MKITFTIPFAHLTGGIRSIFELSNALAKRGHDCFVASPHRPYPLGTTLRGKVKRSILGFADRALPRWLSHRNGEDHTGWLDQRFSFKEVRYLTDDYLPVSDYVVATNWKTASWVSALDNSRGKKSYLVFDIETWDRGRFPVEEVEKTYHLIPHLITYSDFVAEELQARFNRRASGRFTLGVNTERFYPDPNVKKDESQIRVCMMMRLQPHKGMIDGLKVFERIRQWRPNICLVGFGSREVEHLAPPHVEFHLFPSDDELRRIYSSCDIFLTSSKREGFNLPPMEAMACGCAVVATRTGAIPEFAIQNETILMREVGDIEGLSKDIISLIDHPHEMKRIANNSHQAIKAYSWDNSARLFEGALQNV